MNDGKNSNSKYIEQLLAMIGALYVKLETATQHIATQAIKFTAKCNEVLILQRDIANLKIDVKDGLNIEGQLRTRERETNEQHQAQLEAFGEELAEQRRQQTRLRTQNRHLADGMDYRKEQLREQENISATQAEELDRLTKRMERKTNSLTFRREDAIEQAMRLGKAMDEIGSLKMTVKQWRETGDKWAASYEEKRNELANLEHKTTKRETQLQHQVKALFGKLKDNAPDCDWDTLNENNPLHNLHDLTEIELVHCNDGQTLMAIKSYRKRTGVGVQGSREAIERGAAIHGIYL